MGKRVRITNESVNSYGFRVLTDGVDTSQYGRNPVLLYMHHRGDVIGYMKDIEVKDGEITAEPVFDEATELSQRCKKQWEFGSLRMVSAGLEPIEVSDDPKVLTEGQTRPTVTRSKLMEVSIVDIGANDDATVLMRSLPQPLQKDGLCSSLTSDEYVALALDTVLPLLNDNNNNIINEKKEEMELKDIALLLGLPDTADEAAVRNKIEELNKSSDELEALRTEDAKLKLAAVENLVDGAVRDRRLEAGKRDEFVALGKKIGTDDLKGVLDAMSPRVKLTTIVAHNAAEPAGDKDWKKLSDVPTDKLVELKEKDLPHYKALYKAEYGMEME